MHINRKRKKEWEEDIDNYRRKKEVKQRREEQYENENFNLMTKVLDILPKEYWEETKLWIQNVIQM